MIRVAESAVKSKLVQEDSGLSLLPNQIYMMGPEINVERLNFAHPSSTAPGAGGRGGMGSVARAVGNDDQHSDSNICKDNKTC